MDRTEKDDDKILVFLLTKDSTCSKCAAKLEHGDFIRLTGKDDVLCMKCAGFDHLLFLPSGDPALTRRAQKHSRLSALVLQRFASSSLFLWTIPLQAPAAAFA